MNSNSSIKKKILIISYEHMYINEKGDFILVGTQIIEINTEMMNHLGQEEVYLKEMVYT